LSSAEKFKFALNFLTGERVNYYPDGCDGSIIEALITDYFDEGTSDDEATRMKVKILISTLITSWTFFHFQSSNCQQELINNVPESQQ